MKKAINVFLIILIVGTILLNSNTTEVNATTIVDTYYASAEGLTSTALQDELQTIINKNVVSLSYADMWTTCKEANVDPDNSDNVILFYSGTSVDFDTKSTDGSTGWNREHVWPQSDGGSKTDAHHVMPSDCLTNSVRGNNNFDEITSGSYVSTSLGVVTECKTTSSTFEPRDEVKGDVARILLYMIVRYDYSFDTVISKELALKWNEEDPVDDFESNRNDVIYSYQNNRNPFVDNPEYVTAIWGDSSELTPDVESDSDDNTQQTVDFDELVLAINETITSDSKEQILEAMEVYSSLTTAQKAETKYYYLLKKYVLEYYYLTDMDIYYYYSNLYLFDDIFDNIGNIINGDFSYVGY